MANFVMVTLFITLTTLSSSASAARPNSNKPSEDPLAEKVCRNTTNVEFCRDALYSDPRARTADRIMITYIALDKAYVNVTNTQTLIQSKIIEFENDGESGVVEGLKSCMEKYGNALEALAEMLGNMDSESYDGLDRLSREARNNVFDCEAGFDETKAGSPMTKMNEDLIKLTEICYVVSQLFA